MRVARLVALIAFLFAVGSSLALQPSDVIGEYVRGGENERFGVRLLLSADKRWSTVTTGGEDDTLQGTWRIDKSRLLLRKDAETDWESAGVLVVVPVGSDFVLVQDYDAEKPLEQHHYFKRRSAKQ